MPPLLPFAQHRHHGKLMHVPLLFLAYNTCPELPHLSTSSHLTSSPSHSLSTTIPPSYALRASQLYVCYWRIAHLTCYFDSLHPHPITSLHLLHLLSSLTDLPQLYPGKHFRRAQSPSDSTVCHTRACKHPQRSMQFPIRANAAQSPTWANHLRGTLSLRGSTRALPVGLRRLRVILRSAQLPSPSLALMATAIPPSRVSSTTLAPLTSRTSPSSLVWLAGTRPAV